MSTNLTRNRSEYSSNTGRVAEERFVRAARKKGLGVKKSLREEDMYDHVDYWLTLPDNAKRWGVDVKGNNLPDEIWIEFKNVKGKKGWLYGGATIIAFDMPEEGGFSIVDRQELAFFCEKHISKEVVRNKSMAYLKRYTRSGRQDEISIVKLRDIKALTSYRVWEYEKKY